MTTENQPDRYVSFCGIECDRNATLFAERLDRLVQTGQGDDRWQRYFAEKRQQQARMGQDDLFFIGSQMNNLYAYIESVGDDEGRELLWQLEQQCC